jgi:hypothetical protein
MIAEPVFVLFVSMSMRMGMFIRAWTAPWVNH